MRKGLLTALCCMLFAATGQAQAGQQHNDQKQSQFFHIKPLLALIQRFFAIIGIAVIVDGFNHFLGYAIIVVVLTYPHNPVVCRFHGTVSIHNHRRSRPRVGHVISAAEIIGIHNEIHDVLYIF